MFRYSIISMPFIGMGRIPILSNFLIECGHRICFLVRLRLNPARPVVLSAIEKAADGGLWISALFLELIGCGGLLCSECASYFHRVTNALPLPIVSA